MAELKLVSPLLSNMEVVSRISARGAVSVYIVKSTKTAQTYILKHISVPESQKQVDALLFTGAAATTADAQKYYEQVVTDYKDELETLEKLAANAYGYRFDLTGGYVAEFRRANGCRTIMYIPKGRVELNLG